MAISKWVDREHIVLKAEASEPLGRRSAKWRPEIVNMIRQRMRSVDVSGDFFQVHLH